MKQPKTEVAHDYWLQAIGLTNVGLVLTFEGLIMGVTGKKRIWRTLAAPAEQQIETLAVERIRTVRRALARPTTGE